jgi:Uma2 family endonuclease
MTTQTKQMTVAEFMALPDDENRHELVRGELRTMPPPKGMHGLIEARILEELGIYLRERARQSGWQPREGPDARDRTAGFAAGGEFGIQFATPDDPHQIRGADVAYIPPEQMARVAWNGVDYFPAVPALVVEVVSATDRADAVAEKVQDYLAGGARRVWCVYPQRRFAHIYDPDRPLRAVHEDESLTDEELLPGFALSLAAILPQAVEEQG